MRYKYTINSLDNGCECRRGTRVICRILSGNGLVIISSGAMQGLWSWNPMRVEFVDRDNKNRVKFLCIMTSVVLQRDTNIELITMITMQNASTETKYFV